MYSMPIAKLKIYRPKTSAELDSYASYGVEDPHPEFKDGDRVWVRGIVDNALVYGEIRGLVMRHIVDVWIVDFGAQVSGVYPWSCVPVSHGQFLKPEAATAVLVAWAGSEPQPAKPPLVVDLDKLIVDRRVNQNAGLPVPGIRVGAS